MKGVFLLMKIPAYLPSVKVVTSRTEDLALIEGLKNGDLKTLENIYRTYIPPINGFIRKNGGNTEDAKDVFQEAVMVMYRKVQAPDFQLTGAFFSLLFPICRNLWLKSLRKRPMYEEVSSARDVTDPLAKDISDACSRQPKRFGKSAQSQ